VKARHAKKLLKQLAILHLAPGDVIFCSLPLHITSETMRVTRAKLMGIFPGHKVLVAHDGMTLSAVREGEGPNGG
jgi:hypothetical protein